MADSSSTLNYSFPPTVIIKPHTRQEPTQHYGASNINGLLDAAINIILILPCSTPVVQALNLSYSTLTSSTQQKAVLDVGRSNISLRYRRLHRRQVCIRLIDMVCGVSNCYNVVRPPSARTRRYFQLSVHSLSFSETHTEQINLNVNVRTTGDKLSYCPSMFNGLFTAD